MTDFIFCLIFIQVSIFFIVGITLLASFYLGCRKIAVADIREQHEYRSGRWLTRATRRSDFRMQGM